MRKELRGVMRITDKMRFLKRLLAVMAVMCTTSLIFYAYLPPLFCPIKAMNEEIGYSKVDAIFVGTSHVFNGIVPAELFEDYGIASYVLAGGGQAPWQSFFYIKKGVKYQKPKIVVLDMYAFAKADSSVVDYKHTVDNMLAFPCSLDKVMALKASGMNNIMDFMLVFPFTHDDYSSVKGLSFNKESNADRILGYIYNAGKYDGETFRADPDYSLKDAIDQKSEEYLRMCIRYCKENGIDIVLVNTPWPSDKEKYQRKFNYISDVAKEYDVPFLDGCLLIDKLGIIYSKDSYDESHLNYEGAIKWTAYIGEYIDENYVLPDRRKQSGYEVYWNNVARLKQLSRESSKQ